MNTHGLVEWFAVGANARAACAGLDWHEAAEVTSRGSGCAYPAGGAAPKALKRLHLTDLADVSAAKGWDIVSYELRDGDDMGRVLRGFDQGQEVDVVTINQETFGGRIITSRVDQMVKALIAKGVVFEILFAPALASRAGRQIFIDHVKQLVKVTRCRHVMLSCGGGAAAVRRPADLANLLTLGGVSYAEASALMRGAHAAVRARMERRRGGGRGIVGVDGGEGRRRAHLPREGGVEGAGHARALPLADARGPPGGLDGASGSSDVEEDDDDDEESEASMAASSTDAVPTASLRVPASASRATLDDSSEEASPPPPPSASAPAARRSTLDDSSSDTPPPVAHGAAGGKRSRDELPPAAPTAAAPPAKKKRVVVKKSVVVKKKL